MEANFQEIAIASALALACGLRAYAVIFIVALAAELGADLPGRLDLLHHPAVIAASGFMAVIELLIDKVRWIDNMWDALNSFVRIPVGAALVAAVFAEGNVPFVAAAAFAGGVLSAGVHFAKSGTRVALNAAPTPVPVWIVSLAEDALVVLALWLAIAHPYAFFPLLVAALIALLLLGRFVWNSLVVLVRRGSAEGHGQ